MTDIQSIIAQMTLEEKAALCTGATAWSTTPIDRLGVPEMIVTDGPHGVRRAAEMHSMASTACRPPAFPPRRAWLRPGMSLCAGLGQALGEECMP